MSSNYQHPYLNYTFPGKRDGEEIIMLTRRHWFILFLTFLPMVFLLGFILFLITYGESFSTFSMFSVDPDIYYLTISFLSVMFWIICFVLWIDYYFDVWILTEERIINMEQYGLFRREISELEHGKIQDVTTEVLGIFPTILGYGEVFIQTAAERERFQFKQVPQPQKIRARIMKLQEYAIKEDLKEESLIMRGKE